MIPIATAVSARRGGKPGWPRRLLPSPVHACAPTPPCSRAPSGASGARTPGLGGAFRCLSQSIGSTRNGFLCNRSRLSGGSLSSSGGARGQVSLTPDRLREFIHAELNYFAQRTLEPLTLQHIVQASSPRKVLKLVYNKLPYFFAKRVKHIEELEGWEQQPELLKLREIFLESFRLLRLCDVDVTGDGADGMHEVIYSIRKRHKPVTALLGEAMRKLNKEDPTRTAFLQRWADTFLLNRISTEMLTSHYVAIIENIEKSLTLVGVVDTKCNPSQICEEAALHVRKEFPAVTIEVQAHNCLESKTEIEFSYIPRYLFYVVQELLRNSAKATELRRAGKETAPGPIVVTVCADHKQVAISIQDEAGGVPVAVNSEVWSYFFSTSESSFNVYADGGSPLSGWGMGLPLGRLYAGYLSGTLELMNMPGIGVDAYLFLNRISLEDSNSTAAP